MKQCDSKGMYMKIFRFLIVLSLALVLSHCADLMKIMKQTGIQEPAVHVSSAKLSGLSFDQADLLFDIEISNPNSIGISLAGFDYDLELNSVSFLKGDQKKKLEIRAKDVVTVQLPLSLSYRNIYETYQSLKTEDRVAYALKTGLSFDLPLLGVVRVPVSTSGNIPMPKLPSISLKSINLEKLSLTSADFNALVEIGNPNSWSLLVNTLQYGLTINGKQWMDGTTTKGISLDPKRETSLHIPFSLNFMEIGSSVYRVITNGKGLDYKFTGKADLSSSLEMLGEFQLPFNMSGKIDVLK